MNGQVYQQHNQRNDQEQGDDAQPVSQAETCHPDDDQNSEKRLQHRRAFPAKCYFKPTLPCSLRFPQYAPLIWQSHEKHG